MLAQLENNITWGEIDFLKTCANIHTLWFLLTMPHGERSAHYPNTYPQSVSSSTSKAKNRKRTL